jgi:hypothetical protein
MKSNHLDLIREKFIFSWNPKRKKSTKEASGLGEEFTSPGKNLEGIHPRRV